MSRPHYLIAVILMVAALGAPLVLYERLPATIPLHWNLHGQVDGYGTKEWAVFALPSLMAALLVLSTVNWLPQWYKSSGPLSPPQVADRFSELVLRGLEPR